jgi:repressor LexA
MNLERLSPVQEQVLSALRRRAEAGEPMPSYRELRAEFRWQSTGTVRDHLQALARKGYVELSGPGHRSIRLTERLSVRGVPLVGRVAAGSPVVADENVERRIPVPAEWTAKGVHFALRVDGDSMIGAGIYEGDYVIVRQHKDPPTGKIVVALIEDRTTVKRLTRQGSRVVLQPENPRHRPISIESESASIQGVVVGLMREYPGRDSIRWTSRSVGASVASVGRRRSSGT